MAFNLNRLVAIITGGSIGLGRATAEQFINNGAKVAILDLPESNGEDVANELGSKNCIFSPCDVTDTRDMEDALEMTRVKFGNEVHVLVNCASIATTRGIYNVGRKQCHPLDTLQELLETNVTGTFNAIRCTVPIMIKNNPSIDGQRGVIINTTCTSAYDGVRGQMAFAMSKAAVASMTLPLSRELSRHGIRAASIAPGYFATPTIQGAPDDILQFVSIQKLLPKRLGRSSEYATLAQKIVENPYINGENIRLDAGIRLSDFTRWSTP